MESTYFVLMLSLWCCGKVLGLEPGLLGSNPIDADESSICIKNCFEEQGGFGVGLISRASPGKHQIVICISMSLSHILCFVFRRADLENGAPAHEPSDTTQSAKKKKRALENEICWFRCRGAAKDASVEEQADGQLYSLYIVRVYIQRRDIYLYTYIYLYIYIHSRELTSTVLFVSFRKVCLGSPTGTFSIAISVYIFFE